MSRVNFYTTNGAVEEVWYQMEVVVVCSLSIALDRSRCSVTVLPSPILSVRISHYYLNLDLCISPSSSCMKKCVA